MGVHGCARLITSGGRTTWVKGSTITARFVNYLQYQGVRPGRNGFTIQLERYGRIRLRSFAVLRGTGVTETSLSPARLQVSIERPRYQVAVGKELTIRYSIANRGDRPAVRVAITP